MAARHLPPDARREVFGSAPRLLVPMRVTLTDAEFRICRWLAAQRHAVNRASHVVDRQLGPQSAEQTDLDGIGGEFAFAKAANLYPDMSLSPRQGSFDAVLYGHSIDVKTTKYASGMLLATTNKCTDPADVFVLVMGSMPSYVVAGWAWGRELLHADNLRDLGHGVGYALPQHRLRPIASLLGVGTPCEILTTRIPGCPGSY